MVTICRSTLQPRSFKDSPSSFLGLNLSPLQRLRFCHSPPPLLWWRARHTFPRGSSSSAPLSLPPTVFVGSKIPPAVQQFLKQRPAPPDDADFLSHTPQSVPSSHFNSIAGRTGDVWRADLKESPDNHYVAKVMNCDSCKRDAVLSIHFPRVEPSATVLRYIRYL